MLQNTLLTINERYLTFTRSGGLKTRVQHKHSEIAIELGAIHHSRARGAFHDWQLHLFASAIIAKSH